MFTQDLKIAVTECICPECKNSIDITRYPNLAQGIIIECNHCGMTLLVKEINEGKVTMDIVDEGK